MDRINFLNANIGYNGADSHCRAWLLAMLAGDNNTLKSTAALFVDFNSAAGLYFHQNFFIYHRSEV